MTSHEGEETEDEVVLELRELMRREAAQTRALPGGSLKDADGRTQAAVHWLQAAWAEESSRSRESPASLPAWTQRAPSRSRRTRRLAVAAAALAAAALAAMILPHPTAEPSETPSELLVGDVAPSAVTTFAPIPQEVEQAKPQAKKSTDLVLAFYEPRMPADQLIDYVLQLSGSQVHWIAKDIDGRPTRESRTRFVQVGQSIAVQDFLEGMTQAMDLLQRLDDELFQPADAKPEAAPSKVRETIRLSRLSMDEAQHLLISTWPRGLVLSGVESVGLLTLQGSAAVVSEARTLIETAERPLPQVLLHWSLIEAVTPEELGEREPVTEDIFNALTTLAPRKVFRQSGDFFVRGAAGGDAHLVVESATGSLKGTTPERPGSISLGVNVRGWEPKAGKLNLTDCVIEIRRNSTERLTTDLSIIDGETTVIGSIGSDQLFVALTVSIVE